MGLDDAEPTAAQESSDFYEPAAKSGGRNSGARCSMFGVIKTFTAD